MGEKIVKGMNFNKEWPYNALKYDIIIILLFNTAISIIEKSLRKRIDKIAKKF